jgi:hypothetical protein
MRFLSGVLLLALLAVSATAQPWYARGDFNGWAADNAMVDQGGGHYTASITGLFDSSPFNWKIATSDWATAMPASDSRVYSDDSGNINFHLYDQTTWTDGWFPNNARRVGYDDHQQFGWEIVGSFNNWPTTFDPNFQLTDMGSGLYRGSFALNAGFYDFKFRGLVPQTPTPPANGVWDTAIGNDFGNGAGNNTIAVGTNGDLWNFELDLPKGRWRAYTDAAPPGQAGDYNNSGITDAADYTLWRDNLGAPAGTLPNDKDGGVIGQAQYNTWKANFGLGVAKTWLARNTAIGTQTPLPDQTLTSLGGDAYSSQFTGLTPGENYDFKVIRSDLSASVPGSPMRVRANANGEIKLNFFDLTGASWSDGWSPASADRIGYADPGQFGWEIVGSFNTWPGTNDPLYALTDQGNGLYAGSFTFATTGAQQFKFRHLDPTNAWNLSIGDDFGNAAGNGTFTVNSTSELWHFKLDLPNGRWQVYLDGSGAVSNAVPEPTSAMLAVVGMLLVAARLRRKTLGVSSQQ